MAVAIPDDERKLITMLPILSNWIKNNRNLTDNEMISFFNQFQGLMPLALESGLNPMLETVSCYRKHVIYGKDVEVILSLRGMKWLDDFNKRACVLVRDTAVKKL